MCAGNGSEEVKGPQPPIPLSPYNRSRDPVSALGYIRYQRNATDYEEEYGRFDAGRDLDRILSAPGDNTFLIKINKWFSL